MILSSIGRRGFIDYGGILLGGKGLVERGCSLARCRLLDQKMGLLDELDFYDQCMGFAFSCWSLSPSIYSPLGGVVVTVAITL
jgi:hypothetical protein